MSPPRPRIFAPKPPDRAANAARGSLKMRFAETATGSLRCDFPGSRGTEKRRVGTVGFSCVLTPSRTMGFDKEESGPLIETAKDTTKINISMVVAVLIFFAIGGVAFGVFRYLHH